MHRLEPEARAMQAVAVVAVLFIYVPPIYMLLLSFNPGLLPTVPSFTEVSLKWYTALISEERMLVALRESVFVAIATASLSAAVAVPAALAYMEFRRGRSVWFTFVLFSMFVPGVIQGLALSVVFRLGGFKPSLWTVVAGHLLWALPFAFIVVLTNLSMLKRNLLLAAYDLGASWNVALRDVILPLIRPGIIGAFLFSFLLSFNEFNRAFYLVGAHDTLPIYMFGVMNAGTSPTIYSLAGSTLIASLVCFLIVVVLARRFARA